MSLENISEKELEHGRKLLRLARRATIKGEKDAAEMMLEKFLKKHKLNLGDVDPDANNRILKALKPDELDLLLTIVVSVNPYTRYVSDLKTLEVKCDLDDEDYKEVLKKYDYFVKMWRVEKELLITAFHTKHKQYFQPDQYAQKKWRARNTENESISKFKTETTQANEEWLKMQRDFTTGKVSEKALTKDVVNSQDRIKIMAFNTSRSYHLEQILLPADYLKNSKTIE